MSEYEIILVDDGSEDACPQICEDYAAKYPNISVTHRENGGLSAARNSGIDVAQGEYICFVDSDDYWQPNVLGGLMAQIERDKLDVLRFRFQNVNEQYQVFSPYKYDHNLDNDYSEVPTDGITFLNDRMGTQCYAVMFILKRSLIVESGLLFTEGIYFEDTDWTPRMLVRAQRVASTDTIVYNYLMRSGSITNAIAREKQQKVLDDKMRLVGELQRQAKELAAQGNDIRWFGRMIADTVISIIGILSTDFYRERKAYLNQLWQLNIYPLQSTRLKAKLINLSPRFVVELLHVKNH